jgi:hypothetical protein
MNKQIKIFTAFIAAIFLVLPVSAATVRVSKVNSAIETDRLSYKGSYPVLRGILDKKEQSNLNVSFREMEQKARKNAELAARQLGSDQITNHIKVEGVFEYTVKRNCSGVMSILFTDYLFSGGAHGRTIETGRTFSQITGREYSLKSLFKPDTDYVTFISNEIKKQMKERDLTDKQLTPFEKISKKLRKKLYTIKNKR